MAGTPCSHTTPIFDAELMRRYARRGARYASYPGAECFHPEVGESTYKEAARASNDIRETRGLSLHFHIPFCDTGCYYCDCDRIVTKNQAHAEPYVEHLCREVALQGELFDRARRVEQLHWGGGTPTFLPPAQTAALMRWTRKHFRFRDDDEGDYSVDIDARRIDLTRLRFLRNIGFNRLRLGVQDFDPEVQRAVNRIQSEAETRAVVEAARAAKFRSIGIDLIYGLPRQTPKSFERTLERVMALDPDRLSLSSYIHLPERFAVQRRIRGDELPSDEQSLEMLSLAVERFTDYGYAYIGMDHFAKPEDPLAVGQRNGTLRRTFHGYSTHADCDLVSMGITGVSALGEMYYENVHGLDEYYSRVDAGRTAVHRGFRPSADDRLRRDVIMALLAYGRLDIPALEGKHGIEFEHYFRREAPRLVAMQTDGLLRIGRSVLEVLPRGLLLVENVCEVFDRYPRAEVAATGRPAPLVG